MAYTESLKLDSLQALSDRLQQLSDVSSRFDALTKETEDKLDNVTKTANILQEKMSPINTKMEYLRERRKAYESCKLFLKQTSSYQTTTEKYIRDLHQSKIADVRDFVASLTRAKESHDFFDTYLPQEKNVENLRAIISEGSKNMALKFKEILKNLSDSEKFSPEKCNQLANCKINQVNSFLPKFDKKMLDDLALITDWLDMQEMSSLYLNSYAEVRAHTLESTVKKLRSSLVGVGHTSFGASPAVSRKGVGKDTPSKTKSMQRRHSSKDIVKTLGRSNSSVLLDRRKSRNPQLGLSPALGSDGFEQPEIDHEDLCIIITAFTRLCRLEFELLGQFRFKVAKPQLLADAIIAQAKKFLIEEMRNFTASVRREFKQDPESLLRLVAVLDRLRQLQSELSAALAPCSASVRAEIDDLAKEMSAQALVILEDYRDDVMRDSSGAPVRQPLPADGTVHELTLQSLKFLQQLHQYEHTAYRILSRDSSGDGVDQRTRRRAIGGYLSQTLANLLRTLDARSEQFTDPVLRSIFLLNNYRYVHQRLDREKMTPTMEAFNCEAVKFFEEYQRKHKESYLSKGWERVLEIVMEKSKPLSQQRMAPEMSGKLSDREKALIKEKFKSFNEEFMAAYKTQRNYSVPDAELRLELINENKDFLLTKYAMFRDKYISVPFTSKKDKYIKYTSDDIERMLEDFFRGD